VVFKKLWRGLTKTREKIGAGLARLLGTHRKLDDAFLDELEEVLYTGDLGPTGSELVAEVKAAYAKKHIREAAEVQPFLRARLLERLVGCEGTLSRAASGPTVLLVAGVNGSGKTTSIAKLAKRLKDRGHKIVLSASDTFRAAAVEQLEIWARRIGVDIVKQQTGADPAAVAFDATERAIARNADFLIVDTAGRLHTNKGLMEELKKIVRVIQRKIPDAPHETLLVLDATTGQNAIRQAKEFSATVPVTGLLLAKLDGTAKGGAVFGIRAELPCPVKFIGVGEGIDDLLDFEPEAFVDAVLQMEPQADEAVGR
jgi:fused signal recognition particle receptor